MRRSDQPVGGRPAATWIDGCRWNRRNFDAAGIPATRPLVVVRVVRGSVAVLVNAIGPALTETDLTRDYLSDMEFCKKAISAIPLGRLGQPEDIVATALLLLSPGGAFITGQTIYVDGGRTLV